MTDIATDRARIEQEVGSRTLIDVLTDTVAAHADLPAYSDKHHVPEGESWRTYTWTDVRERGLDVAAGLIGLGRRWATRSRSWPPTGSSTTSPT